jgi:hypothetical protein
MYIIRLLILSPLSETRMTLYAMNMLEDGRFFATELAMAVLPFTFSSRGKYNAILRMMSIFHVSFRLKHVAIFDIQMLLFTNKSWFSTRPR